MNTLTVPIIVDAFGGPTAFGRVIGVRTSTASEMKRRGVIPVQYWPKVVSHDPIDRERFTYEDLVEVHCKPKGSQ